MELLIRFFVLLIKRSKILMINLLIALIVGVAYSFFVAPKMFLSSITFIHPGDAQGLGLLAQVGVGTIGGGESLKSEHVKTIFESLDIKMQIINKFNYYKKLKLEKSPSRLKSTLKVLEKDISFSQEEKGSLGATEIISYNLSVNHTSPDTALIIVNEYYRLMDSTMVAISTARANKTKSFMTIQLTSAQRKLDSLQNVMKKFQQNNRAYELNTQMQMALNSYSDIRSKIILNDIKIRSMLAEVSESHPQVLDLKRENKLLEEQLTKAEKGDGSSFPGINKLTNLYPEYTNLYRNVEVQNSLVTYLGQEVEQARIKEAKDISSLVTVSSAHLPEFKDKPKRLFLLAGIVGMYMFVIISIMVMLFLYKELYVGSKVDEYVRKSLAE